MAGQLSARGLATSEVVATSSGQHGAAAHSVAQNGSWVRRVGWRPLA